MTTRKTSLNGVDNTSSEFSKRPGVVAKMKSENEAIKLMLEDYKSGKIMKEPAKTDGLIEGNCDAYEIFIAKSLWKMQSNGIPAKDVEFHLKRAMDYRDEMRRTAMQSNPKPTKETVSYYDNSGRAVSVHHSKVDIHDLKFNRLRKTLLEFHEAPTFPNAEYVNNLTPDQRKLMMWRFHARATSAIKTANDLLEESLQAAGIEHEPAPEVPVWSEWRPVNRLSARDRSRITNAYVDYYNEGVGTVRQQRAEVDRWIRSSNEVQYRSNKSGVYQITFTDGDDFLLYPDGRFESL